MSNRALYGRTTKRGLYAPSGRMLYNGPRLVRMLPFYASDFFRTGYSYEATNLKDGSGKARMGERSDIYPAMADNFPFTWNLGGDTAQAYWTAVTGKATGVCSVVAQIFEIPYHDDPYFSYIFSHITISQQALYTARPDGAGRLMMGIRATGLLPNNPRPLLGTSFGWLYGERTIQVTPGDGPYTINFPNNIGGCILTVFVEDVEPPTARDTGYSPRPLARVAISTPQFWFWRVPK